MKTSIKASGMKLTDAMRSVIEEKMSLLDPKVERFGDVVKARVEVCKTTVHHRKGDVFHAEIIIKLPGKDACAEATSDDLYKAFGEAKKEVARQIAVSKNVHIDKRKAKHEKTAKR
ncbi:MAG: ribosome-associated translation inhibitor RaiA [Patescibacteria group bacterium]|nr:ribosome-associated translation inhibitor RaiA [Patescibacteria group bacterium]